MVLTAIILQIAIFRPPKYEGPVSFDIAFVTLLVFIMANIGGLLIFLKGQ